MKPMNTGIEFKIVGMIGKTLFMPMVAWLYFPVYDWIILQIVNDYSALSVGTKAFLNDAKLWLGLIIMIFTILRLIMGSYKIKKEIESLKKNKEE